MGSDRLEHEQYQQPRCIKHEPKGPYTRDKDGNTADLLNVRDYPIRAVCMFCSQPIVTYGLYGRAAEWYEPEADCKPTVFPREGWSITGP